MLYYKVTLMHLKLLEHVNFSVRGSSSLLQILHIPHTLCVFFFFFYVCTVDECAFLASVSSCPPSRKVESNYAERLKFFFFVVSFRFFFFLIIKIQWLLTSVEHTREWEFQESPKLLINANSFCFRYLSVFPPIY